jgi:enoyl-CoA hydratase/carnithine racemase
MGEFVKKTYHNKVMIITLNRPEVYNALNTELMRQLKAALLESNNNPDINCVVLNGNGDAFCTGADIKEFSKQTNNTDAAVERAKLTKEVHTIIPKLHKPVIASVHSYVFAGGCGIALACDMVVAADNTLFSYPEITRGFVPAIVSPNLIRLTGRKKAFELLITGKKISAKEAYEMDLVNKVVPLAELKEETMKLADTISGYSQTALMMTKKLFYEVAEVHFDEAIEIAKNANVAMRQTEDFKKGVNSFMNRK